MQPKGRFWIDLGLWALAALLAYAFRKPGLLQSGIPLNVWAYVALSGLVMAGLQLYYGLHRQMWERAGLRDLVLLARAAVLASVVTFALAFLLHGWLQLPRSVPLLGGVLGFGLLAGARVLSRLSRERTAFKNVTQGSRVLIVGAGEAGSMIAREMQRHPEAGLEPVGFLDDDPAKHRQWLVGLPVFGAVQDLTEVARQEGAQEVLIAVPSAEGEFVRRVIDLAREADLKYRIIPGVFEILKGGPGLGQIREVNLEDLLRRPPCSSTQLK
ncbi:nucleoside-diphosphate sugar epimerase/dehydratase [Deinococcus lacus]|uniref:Nucleoside-diphosphate sugar epimerase/dehydratase n=1 Tax=Deinococcus lacus TaxID=392561 RepID=A0ABW1YEM3_9DEIO